MATTFCCNNKSPPSPDGLAPRPSYQLLPLRPDPPPIKKFPREPIASWGTYNSRSSAAEDLRELRAIFEDLSDNEGMRNGDGAKDKKGPHESHVLKSVKSKIRKRFSKESGLSKRRSKSSVGTSEEESERRAELRRLQKQRIQEELSNDRVYDEDAMSIRTVPVGGLSSTLTRTETRKAVSVLEKDLPVTPAMKALPPPPLVWTAANALNHDELARIGTSTLSRFPIRYIRHSVSEVLELSSIRLPEHSPLTPRCHSWPLPPPPSPSKTPHTLLTEISYSEFPQPPRATLTPIRLPSISDSAIRERAWRLSSAEEHRDARQRTLSREDDTHPYRSEYSDPPSGMQTPRTIRSVDESTHMASPQPQPSEPPLKRWLQSQGLRLPAEVIATLPRNSSDSSGSVFKISRKPVARAYSPANDFGGVDGSQDPQAKPTTGGNEETPPLRLHEMHIHSRMASSSYPLTSSASSPELSAQWGSRERSHDRAVSNVSLMSRLSLAYYGGYTVVPTWEGTIGGAETLARSLSSMGAEKDAIRAIVGINSGRIGPASLHTGLPRSESGYTSVYSVGGPAQHGDRQGLGGGFYGRPIPNTGVASSNLAVPSKGMRKTLTEEGNFEIPVGNVPFSPSFTRRRAVTDPGTYVFSDTHHQTPSRCIQMFSSKDSDDSASITLSSTSSYDIRTAQLKYLKPSLSRDISKPVLTTLACLSNLAPKTGSNRRFVEVLTPPRRHARIPSGASSLFSSLHNRFSSRFTLPRLNVFQRHPYLRDRTAVERTSHDVFYSYNGSSESGSVNFTEGYAMYDGPAAPDDEGGSHLPELSAYTYGQASLLPRNERSTSRGNKRDRSGSMSPGARTPMSNLSMSPGQRSPSSPGNLTPTSPGARSPALERSPPRSPGVKAPVHRFPETFLQLPKPAFGPSRERSGYGSIGRAGKDRSRGSVVVGLGEDADATSELWGHAIRKAANDRVRKFSQAVHVDHKSQPSIGVDKPASGAVKPASSIGRSSVSFRSALPRQSVDRGRSPGPSGRIGEHPVDVIVEAPSGEETPKKISEADEDKFDVSIAPPPAVYAKRHSVFHRPAVIGGGWRRKSRLFTSGPAAVRETGEEDLGPDHKAKVNTVDTIEEGVEMLDPMSGIGAVGKEFIQEVQDFHAKIDERRRRVSVQRRMSAWADELHDQQRQARVKSKNGHWMNKSAAGSDMNAADLPTLGRIASYESIGGGSITEMTSSAPASMRIDKGKGKSVDFDRQSDFRPKKRRVTADPVSWSRYPSFNREERTGTSGPKTSDQVKGYDWAVKSIKPGGELEYVDAGKRKHFHRHHTGKNAGHEWVEARGRRHAAKHNTACPKSPDETGPSAYEMGQFSGGGEEIGLNNEDSGEEENEDVGVLVRSLRGVNRLSQKFGHQVYKTRTKWNVKMADDIHGRRGSISMGGKLEYPELEVLPLAPGMPNASGETEVGLLEAEVAAALRLEERITRMTRGMAPGVDATDGAMEPELEAFIKQTPRAFDEEEDDDVDSKHSSDLFSDELDETITASLIGLYEREEDPSIDEDMSEAEEEDWCKSNPFPYMLPRIDLSSPLSLSDIDAAGSLAGNHSSSPPVTVGQTPTSIRALAEDFWTPMQTYSQLSHTPSDDTPTGISETPNLAPAGPGRRLTISPRIQELASPILELLAQTPASTQSTQVVTAYQSPTHGRSTSSGNKYLDTHELQNHDVCTPDTPSSPSKTTFLRRVLAHEQSSSSNNNFVDAFESPTIRPGRLRTQSSSAMLRHATPDLSISASEASFYDDCVDFLNGDVSPLKHKFSQDNQSSTITVEKAKDITTKDVEPAEIRPLVKPQLVTRISSAGYDSAFESGSVTPTSDANDWKKIWVATEVNVEVEPLDDTQTLRVLSGESTIEAREARRQLHISTRSLDLTSFMKTPVKGKGKEKEIDRPVLGTGVIDASLAGELSRTSRREKYRTWHGPELSVSLDNLQESLGADSEQRSVMNYRAVEDGKAPEAKAVSFLGSNGLLDEGVAVHEPQPRISTSSANGNTFSSTSSAMTRIRKSAAGWTPETLMPSLEPSDFMNWASLGDTKVLGATGAAFVSVNGLLSASGEGVETQEAREKGKEQAMTRIRRNTAGWQLKVEREEKESRERIEREVERLWGDV